MTQSLSSARSSGASVQPRVDDRRDGAASDGRAIRCLVIDCDQEQAVASATGLREAGCKVAWAPALDAATESLRRQLPDAIVIDRFPLDEDCVAAIRTWRDIGVHVPIVMIVDTSGIDHRNSCLDAGIDGVVVRPFEFAELAARLRALARASARFQGAGGGAVRVGTLDFDFRNQKVELAGRTIPLLPRQFKVLAELAANLGATLSRDELLIRVWGLNFDPGTKIVETQVSHLRSALDQAGIADAVQTVRGKGYRLNPDAVLRANSVDA